MVDAAERGYLEYHAKVQFTGHGNQTGGFEPKMVKRSPSGRVHTHTLELSYFQCPVTYNSGNFLSDPK